MSFNMFIFPMSLYLTLLYYSSNYEENIPYDICTEYSLAYRSIVYLELTSSGLLHLIVAY